MPTGDNDALMRAADWLILFVVVMVALILGLVNWLVTRLAR